MAIVIIFYVLIIALMLAAQWKIFEKAGKPGWAALIPIYNIIVGLQVAKKPIWWIIMFFIPLVNIVFCIMYLYALSTRFGYGAGFTIGMIFLPMIFIPILGFGGAKYINE